MSLDKSDYHQIIESPVENNCEDTEKQLCISQTQEELTELTKANLQNISNMKFLEYSDEARLQSITRDISGNKISQADIISGKVTDIQFLFSFQKDAQGNDIINENLYLKTTAGQVLPDHVASVILDGKEYTRTSIDGEFFAQDGKRLIIHHNTKIQITQVREEKELLALIKANQEEKNNYLANNPEANAHIISQGLSRGYDPEFVMGLFGVFFSGVKNISLEMQEDFFTQIDREIGYVNESNQTMDKNNLSEEDKAMLLGKMQEPTDPERIKGVMKDFPELNQLAYKLSIPNEMLYAIWSNETSYSFGTHKIPEPGSRTSYGYFSILGTQYAELGYQSETEMNYALNHPDQEIRNQNNIKTLESFIHMKPGLLSALQNKDFHTVASLYNGSKYEQLAVEGKQYDDKLRRAADRYLAA